MISYNDKHLATSRTLPASSLLKRIRQVFASTFNDTEAPTQTDGNGDDEGATAHGVALNLSTGVPVVVCLKPAYVWG